MTDPDELKIERIKGEKKLEQIEMYNNHLDQLDEEDFQNAVGSLNTYKVKRTDPNKQVANMVHNIFNTRIDMLRGGNI